MAKLRKDRADADLIVRPIVDKFRSAAFERYRQIAGNMQRYQRVYAVTDDQGIRSVRRGQQYRQRHYSDIEHSVEMMPGGQFFSSWADRFVPPPPAFMAG
jgi:hypothetical protein